jgi:hypothetical protein
MGIIRKAISVVPGARFARNRYFEYREQYAEYRQHLHENRLVRREPRLRAIFRLGGVETLHDLPSIVRSGTFASSRLGLSVFRAFERAADGTSKLSLDVRAIEGMSGQKYRSLINNLVEDMPTPSYLEIGSWAGSTAAAAIYKNRVRALCIDNWSEFGGRKEIFASNIKSVLSPDVEFTLIEDDFRAVDFRSIGLFDIYFFDGPHAERDHYDGIRIVQPALHKEHVLVVDDWNWLQVRVATLQALADIGGVVDSAVEVRTTLDNTFPVNWGKDSDWHNGYFVALIRKR